MAQPQTAGANGADLPPEVLVQGFVKVEEGHLRLMFRFPLALLSSFSLPKRGPGYLDLTQIDEKMAQAAGATSRQIEMLLDGVPLTPAVREARISLASDRSFDSYATALAHVEGPPLPTTTDLYWNQGFFDVELDYPIPSVHGDFSIRFNVAPELGDRLRLRLTYLPLDGPEHLYELPGGAGRMPLDPKWYQSAWAFALRGFLSAFAGDRWVFLLCLIAPFRQFRSLLAVILVMTGVQALTLTTIATRLVASSTWLETVFSSSLAAAVVLLAIGNLAAPSLRRRLLITAVIGGLGGYALGHVLADALRFAATQAAVSILSFNVGIALGEIVTLGLAVAALRLLFAGLLGPPFGVVVLSVVLGHIGWHWMLDGGPRLGQELATALGAGIPYMVRTFSPWLVPALIVGVVATFLPSGFGGAPIRSLRSALFGEDGGKRK
jgi:hypothetical protein